MQTRLENGSVAWGGCLDGSNAVSIRGVSEKGGASEAQSALVIVKSFRDSSHRGSMTCI